jgi:hypothetical protein
MATPARTEPGQCVGFDFEPDIKAAGLPPNRLVNPWSSRDIASAVHIRSAHGSTAAVTLSVVRRLGFGYDAAGCALDGGLQRNVGNTPGNAPVDSGSSALEPGMSAGGSPFIQSQGYAPRSTRVRKRRMLSAGHPALTVPIDWPCRRRHRADNCLLPD